MDVFRQRSIKLYWGLRTWLFLFHLYWLPELHFLVNKPFRKPVCISHWILNRSSLNSTDQHTQRTTLFQRRPTTRSNRTPPRVILRFFKGRGQLGISLVVNKVAVVWDIGCGDHQFFWFVHLPLAFGFWVKWLALFLLLVGVIWRFEDEEIMDTWVFWDPCLAITLAATFYKRIACLSVTG